MPTKRELKLIALSAVFLLFIAGCGRGDVATGAPTTPFLGGPGGLEISFLEGGPPAEVTDGGTFPFQAIVILKNAGERDVKKDEIKLSLIGFLPSQFGITDSTDEAKLKDQHLLEDLSGRKRDADGNIIEPVEIFFTFPDKDNLAKNFNFNGQLAGNNIFVFRADACYKYQTRVKSDVCILQGQIDVAADAICKPSEAKAVFSSGSPIKVTSFRQNIAGSTKLQLSFDVEHSGTGEVFGFGTHKSVTTTAGITTTILITEVIADLINAIAKTEGTAKDAVAAKTSAELAKTKLSGFNVNVLSDPDKPKVSDATVKVTSAIGELTTSGVDPTVTEADFSSANTKLKEAKAILESITPVVDCPKDSTNRRAKEDQVIVTVDTGLSPVAETDTTKNYKLSCVGLSNVFGATTAKQRGSVKLINGKRTMTCTLDIPQTRTDFIKPVDITVDFNYAQNADKEVLVKHILTNP